MSTPRFHKEFNTALEAELWLKALGVTNACMEPMQHGEWLVTLEGEYAQRARKAERPLAVSGFHLEEVR